MKTKVTQRRFKVKKGSGCAMCKLWKHGWEGKRTVSELRRLIGVEEQLRVIGY